MFIKVTDKYKKEFRINVDSIVYYLPSTNGTTEINLKDKSYVIVEQSAEEIDKMVELIQNNEQPKEVFRPIANPIFNKSRKFKISYINNNDSMVFLTNLFAHDSYEAFEDTKKYIKSNIDDLNSLFLDSDYITLYIRDVNYFKENEYKLFKSDVQNLVSLKK